MVDLPALAGVAVLQWSETGVQMKFTPPPEGGSVLRSILVALGSQGLASFPP